MKNQEIANQLTSFIPYIEKALESGNTGKLAYNLRRDYKKSVKILFSHLKGVVNKNSSRAQIYITDQTYHNGHYTTCVLCALDHKPVDPHENVAIDMRQNYYDDLTDNLNTSDRSVKDKAVIMIYLLKYISLDLTNQTKHHIYQSNDVLNSVSQFENTSDNKAKYLVLRSRVMSKRSIIALKDADVTSIIEGSQKDKHTMNIGKYCVVTYIPKSQVSSHFIQITKQALKLMGFRFKSYKNPLHASTKINADKSPRLVINTDSYPENEAVKNKSFISVIEIIPDYKLRFINASGQSSAKANAYFKNILSLLDQNSFNDYDNNQLQWALVLGYRFQMDNKAKSGMFGGNQKTMKLINYGINHAGHLLAKMSDSKTAKSVMKFQYTEAHKLSPDEF